MNKILVNNKPCYPSKIVCISRNYVGHINELGNEKPTQSVIFVKPNSAISNELCFDNLDAIHYEGEISFVIKKGKLHAVGFGFDLTKREIQSQLKAKGLPWERAKAFDKAAVFSEFVTIPDGIEKIRMVLFINDELKQSGGFDLMMLKPDEIVREIQSFMTLNDGDIIMTGTPKGVGMIKKGHEFRAKVFSNEALLIESTWIVR